MGDAFCLKWNNHQTTLVAVFDKLFENESLVDCTLAAEGRQLKAHKVVLSACSPYLEELIKNHEDRHPIIIFNSIRYDQLRSILEYMYRGEVNVSQEQLDPFLKVAESLKIRGLTDQGGGENKFFKDDVKNPPKRKRVPSSESSEDREPPKPEIKPDPIEEINSVEPLEEYPMEDDEEEDFAPPGPGTSQGSFSNQDFNNWSGTSDVVNDEVFMAAQQDLSNMANNSQVNGTNLPVLKQRLGTKIPIELATVIRKQSNLPQEPTLEADTSGPSEKRKYCKFCHYSRKRMSKMICDQCKAPVCGEHHLKMCISCYKNLI